MNNPSKFLGQLEKEIMEIVWASKESITVRVVFEVLSKRRKIAYTTVMTIMNRLVNKKLLKRVAEGKAYSYQAIYSKDKFLTKMFHEILQSFIKSFGDVAVANFTKEIEKIPLAKRRKLIKQLEKANE